MDLYHLRLFLHLSETLHFTKTSQACFISPPGLTRVIQRIEEEAGEKFFHRDNRSVTMTRAGLLFKQFARDTLHSWELFKDTLAAEQGNVRGEITLYCSVTASYKILKSFLKTFQHTYPLVQIKLHTGEAEIAIKKVMNGDAEIAIAPRPEILPDRIDFKPVITTPLVFITGRELDTGDVLHTPFILPAHGLSRERVDEWCKKKKFYPGVYAEVSGNEAIITMVSLGFGIGVVPLIVLDQSALKDEITILPLEPGLKEYEVGYCRLRKKQHTHAVKVFWDMIQPLL
jgi:LysR family positive regulator for ilvC